MWLVWYVQVIKRFIMHAKKTAFIVEHDFIMAAYLADRVIVYEGTPSKEAFARQPQSLLTGNWLCCGACTFPCRVLRGMCCSCSMGSGHVGAAFQVSCALVLSGCTCMFPSGNQCVDLLRPLGVQLVHLCSPLFTCISQPHARWFVHCADVLACFRCIDHLFGFGGHLIIPCRLEASELFILLFFSC